MNFQKQLFVLIAGLSGLCLTVPANFKSPSHAGPTPKVVISEIMFNPAGSEYTDEFVELVNLSSLDSVNLAGWQIGDGSSYDLLSDAGYGLTLPPHGYAVILDPGYFGNSTSYDSLIPDSALIITIDNASFAQRGWSNSIPTTVQLLNTDGEQIDAMTYRTDITPGHSLEKVRLAKENSPDNWQQSLSLNGTPGFKNSVSPQNFDLALSVSSEQQQDSVFIFRSVVTNVGLNPSGEFRVVAKFLPDTPQSDTVEVHEKRFNISLAAGDSVSYDWRFECPNPGHVFFFFELVFPRDQNGTNNRVTLERFVPFTPGSIVINEIMYYPDVGNPEWLELYNPTTMPINLKDWKLQKEDESRTVLLAHSDRWLSARGYLVLAQNELTNDFPDELFLLVRDLPALRNSEMAIHLIDPTGHPIDSVYYSASYGKKREFSLERILPECSGLDSSNWALSEVKGGTPGAMNSRSPLTLDLAVESFLLEPNPCPFEGQLTAVIRLKNVGRERIDSCEVTIFLDTDNDSILDAGEKWSNQGLAQVNLNFAEEFTFNLPLTTPGSGYFSVGILAGVLGDQDMKNNTKISSLAIGYPPGTVVINEIQFQPLSGEAEWIELINRSEEKVNLRNWKIVDVKAEQTGTLSNSDSYLEPGRFCVLAGDSSVSVSPQALFRVVKNFPSLNNDSDHLQLLDFSGVLIDEVSYYSDWGGGVGISLERINPDLPSSDPRSWAASADPFGSTPGRQNSVFVQILPTESALSISPNPFSPDGDGHEDVAVIQYELPMKTAYVTLRVFDVMGREVCTLLNRAPSGSRREIVWNGRTNSGERLRIGVYILFFEALDDRLGTLIRLKKPVVIAGNLE